MKQLSKYVAMKINLFVQANVQSSNLGRPNSSGLKSNNDGITLVASFLFSSGIIGSGTITTCIPAATAPITPFGASSNTRHCRQKQEISCSQ